MASCDICRKVVCYSINTTNLIKHNHKKEHRKLQPNREGEGEAPCVPTQISKMHVSKTVDRLWSYCNHLLADLVTLLLSLLLAHQQLKCHDFRHIHFNLHSAIKGDLKSLSREAFVLGVMHYVQTQISNFCSRIRLPVSSSPSSLQIT